MCRILFLCLFVAVGAASRTIENTCPPGLLSSTDHKYLQVRNDSCFHFVLNKPKTYPNARIDCKKDGGILALPKTQSLNDYLTDQLLNTYSSSDEAWIGLYDPKASGQFIWEDGSELAWTNFAKGKGPDNNWLEKDSSNCVVLDPNNRGVWNDQMCEGDFLSWLLRLSYSNNYICQYTADVLDDASDKKLVQANDTKQVAASPRTIENTCPPGLMNTTDRKYLQVWNDSCFHFVLNKQKSYPEANKDCMKDSGTLALPKTLSLNNYLTDHLLNTYNSSDEAWIGLQDQNTQRQFFWEDGSELAWNNFAKGKGPDNNWLDKASDNCVALDPKNGGVWNDRMCEDDFLSRFEASDHSRNYICHYIIHDKGSHIPAAARTIENTCPPGLVISANSNNLQVQDGLCFHFVLDNPKTYSEAKNYCQIYGGSLALPKTKSLNNFLADQLLNKYHRVDTAWIGLHDLKEETKFVWEDGSEIAWSNFPRGQGTHSLFLIRDVEDCVAIDPADGGRWYDFQCDHNLLSWITSSNPSKIFICQYEPDDGR